MRNMKYKVLNSPQKFVRVSVSESLRDALRSLAIADGLTMAGEIKAMVQREISLRFELSERTYTDKLRHKPINKKAVQRP